MHWSIWNRQKDLLTIAHLPKGVQTNIFTDGKGRERGRGSGGEMGRGEKGDKEG